MKKKNLSPGEMAAGRKTFYIFTIFNVVAFYSVSGNIITLYALRLGADSFVIGLLSSFYYLGTLFILFGRFLTSKMGTVRQMGIFWLIRYLFIIPLLSAPVLGRFGLDNAVPGLLIFCTMGFNISRGFAIPGYNPIIGSLATKKLRGSFLARTQIIEHMGSVLVGLSIAVLLGGDAPIYMYTLFFFAGIITGIISARYILKLPESSSGKKYKNENLVKALKGAASNPTIRKFMVNNLISALLITMVAPFLIVYMKEVYGRSDSQIMFFTIFGSLGAITMALMNGFLIDKLGAKPLYFYFTGTLTLALFPVILSPAVASSLFIGILASAVFFLHNMGVTGIRNSAQVYFFAATSDEEQYSLGMIYLMSEGIASGAGSIIGGTLLILLQRHYPGSPAEVYRLYFGLIGILFFILLLMINRMESLGAYSIRHTMAVILSPRDLRAITLINRLNKIKTEKQHQDTIKAIAGSRSTLTTTEILHHLKSPRFTIRAEALSALGHLPDNEEVRRALISEVKNSIHTTAYIAAEIIGIKGISEAVPVLRKQLGSADYYLSGKCMTALAQLDDRESIPRIEAILEKTSNARLINHGATALEIFHSKSSIPILLSKLEKKTAPFLRDEIILSIAGILDIGVWFYPIYISFLERSTDGIAMLEDYIRQSGFRKEIRKAAEAVTSSILLKPRDVLIKYLEELFAYTDDPETGKLLLEGAAKPEFETLDRLFFLISAAAVRLCPLKNPVKSQVKKTDKEKDS